MRQLRQKKDHLFVQRADVNVGGETVATPASPTAADTEIHRTLGRQTNNEHNKKKTCTETPR